jgi:CDGSH-type Zn-finger protein
MSTTQPNLPRCQGLNPAVVTLPVGKHAWCACGLTATAPFCDGAHKGTTLRPKLISVDGQPETVALCQCKYTANPPFCDGSHARPLGQ